MDQYTQSRAELRQLMQEYLSLADLKAICYDLAVNYETLEGSALTEKVIALLGEMERNGRYPELLTTLQQHRPRLAWPQIGQTTSPTAVTSNLPVQPPFFGREAELAKIAEAIHPSARTWGALIDGPGGMGKTAVALRAAHLAPAEHFSRKLFLSAKVRELTAAGVQPLHDFLLPNYIALITELAAELGASEIGRLSPDERTKAVYHLLATERALLVIDNVETFEEVERVRLYQFLTHLPSACKAIVTSRRRTDIDARILRLDRLSAEAALALLDDLAQSKSKRALARTTLAERQTLYEITGGNPLLIKWLAGQLGRDDSDCRTVAEACAFLKAAPPDNDPLEYIFGDLLGTFTAQETAVLAALTYFKQPAKIEWVATIADLSPVAAQTALEDLTDRALLMADEAQTHFLLPELTAVYLRRHRPEAVATTGNRLADHVISLATENGYDQYERFPILETYWILIKSALPFLVLGDNNRLQKACNILRHFLNFYGQWDEWLWLSQEGEEKAISASDWYNAGRRAYHAGWIFYLRGEGKQEIISAYAKRCATHWQTAQAGKREQAISLRLMGWGYRVAQNYEEAINTFQDSISIHRNLIKSDMDLAIDLNSLAEVERAIGNLNDAEEHYHEAIKIAQKINFHEGIAIYTGNLAGLALDRKQWVEAEMLIRYSLPLIEKIGRKEIIARGYWRLATVLTQQNRREEGLPFAQKAVKICTHLRSRELPIAQAVLAECTL